MLAKAPSRATSDRSAQPQLVDARREPLPELHLEPDGLGLDRREARDVVLVLRAAELLVRAQALPLALDPREQLPARRQATLAAPLVLEPVDLDRLEPRGLRERELDVLLDALRRPPVEVRHVV